MAVLNANNLTLFDWVTRQKPTGGIDTVAEVLSQTNEILEDMVLLPCNKKTVHEATIRTGLPSVYFRQINAGVPNSKSTTAQITESVGMMEARSKVDKKLVDLAGGGSSDAGMNLRASESVAFIEAMNQRAATTLFYGNAGVSKEEFTGLSTRFSSLSAGNAANILDAGGTGSNNTSIWLVGWSDQSAFGLFPEGSMAGINHRDLGEAIALDASGNEYQALTSLFQWDLGLMVRDWRYVARTCNINVTDLRGTSGTQATTAATNLLRNMVKMQTRMPTMAGKRFAYYANRTVWEGLALLAGEKTSAVLKVEEGFSQFGHPMQRMSYMGIPIRKVDALLNTEARVV